MFINSQPDLTENPILADDSREYFSQKEFSQETGSLQTNMIEKLLKEIGRVKELVKYYKSSTEPNSRAKAELLDELVTEAYNSLVNYDVSLMNKYYDLLQHCD